MMKKTFMFLMLAMITMTASARQLYIFGNDPFGGWDLKFDKFTALTLAADGETNTIEFTLETEGWYVFTDGIETDGEWEPWKASHRFVVNEVDGDVNPGEYNWTLKQVYGDESLHLLPGSYKITIVAGETEEPVTYETKHVYLYDQTGWESTKLYAWGNGVVELFGGWWATMEYVPETVEQGGITYKVFPFPANGNTYNEFIFSDNGSEEAGKRVILPNVVADKDYYIILTTTEATISDGPVATGISEKVVVNSGKFTATPIYNLSGQQVSDNYKGVVVKNGRITVKK